MGVRLPNITQARHIFQRSLSWTSRSTTSTATTTSDVPRGYFPIYVGEEDKRFVVPVSYLNHPIFQSLLQKAEEELGVDHRAGGLRVPCKEDAFVALTAQLGGCCANRP